MNYYYPQSSSLPAEKQTSSMYPAGMPVAMAGAGPVGYPQQTQLPQTAGPGLAGAHPQGYGAPIPSSMTSTPGYPATSMYSQGLAGPSPYPTTYAHTAALQQHTGLPTYHHQPSITPTSQPYTSSYPYLGTSTGLAQSPYARGPPVPVSTAAYSGVPSFPSSNTGNGIYGYSPQQLSNYPPSVGFPGAPGQPMPASIAGYPGPTSLGPRPSYPTGPSPYHRQ